MEDLNHGPRDFLSRMSWDDLRLVRAIYERGSLTTAASQLGVNHSTVFRRLTNLEALIGVRLFERHRAGYIPTPLAEEMFTISERWADDIASLGRLLMGCAHSPAGELRITTNDTLLVHLLTPILAGFKKEYPNISLDIILSNQSLNLSRRDADIAIRATDNPPETLVGRRLSTIAWAIYGRQIDFQEAPTNQEQLRNYLWVSMNEDFASMKSVQYVRDMAGENNLAYRINSVLGLSEAIQAGIGIGPLPCFIGDHNPQLRRLTEPNNIFATNLWLLTHPDLRQSIRVRVFMDYFSAAITKMRSFLEGRMGRDTRGLNNI